MQIDRPSTSVSNICQALGRTSAARTSFSVSFSLLLNAIHSVFPSDTCVDVPAYQRLDLQAGIQAQTGDGRVQTAPVGGRGGQLYAA